MISRFIKKQNMRNLIRVRDLLLLDKNKETIITVIDKNKIHDVVTRYGNSESVKLANSFAVHAHKMRLIKEVKSMTYNLFNVDVEDRR